MKDARGGLLILTGAAFAYQVLTTAFILLSQRSVSVWPHSLTGTAPASAQPLMRDWMFTSRLAKWQPHRYLTAGFAHSGILHLLLNTDAIRTLPERLEQSVGADVYGTTFALSLIAGHYGHSIWGGAISATGAGAGIAGVYGLSLIHELLRGQSGSEDRQKTIRSAGLGLGRQLLYGLCLPRMFSTAATFSGFLAGIVAGSVFTLASSPTTSGGNQRNMAVFAVWFASLSAFFLVPTLRSAPFLFLQSLFQPGSLSTMGRSRF
jgi:membrane associated rhomboid family serine protease